MAILFIDIQHYAKAISTPPIYNSFLAPEIQHLPSIMATLFLDIQHYAKGGLCGGCAARLFDTRLFRYNIVFINRSSMVLLINEQNNRNFANLEQTKDNM